MSSDNLFRSIHDLKEYLKSYYAKADKEHVLNMNTFYLPPLQSDYVIAIYNGKIDEKTESVNPSNYEPVLIQSLPLSVLENGVTATMGKWGFQYFDVNATKQFSFDYIGMPCEKENNTYTSIIHYYYYKRFTADGVLKIKRENEPLPSIFIINTRTNNIIYILKDCTFSYPTFTASPQSNTIALYKTTVSFSSYRESNSLFDNIGMHNASQIENKRLDYLA